MQLTLEQSLYTYAGTNHYTLWVLVFRSHSPIWDCATIVDFLSQSGENGRPSSASLSPWNNSSFLSQNHSQSLQKHTHTHTLHHTPPEYSPPYAHTSINRLWISLAPALSAFGPQMCFIFSTDLSQTDEMWSREAMFFWWSYLSAIHIPRDKGLVTADTITIALIMRTMWINNERDESNVEPV